MVIQFISYMALEQHQMIIGSNGLKKNLIQQGYNVDNIALPNSKNPNFDEWQSTLAEHITPTVRIVVTPTQTT